MIITILVADFKLRETFFSKLSFIIIELVEFVSSMRAIAVATFKNRDLVSFFPGKERFKTIWTKVFYFPVKAFVKLKDI